MEQHAFTIEVTGVFHGSFEEAQREALRFANGVYDESEAQQPITIVVREAGSSYLGAADGVFCEGCEGNPFAGIRWPTSPNSRSDHEYVERCDVCERYASDAEARDHLLDTYKGATEVTLGEVEGHLYIDVR